MRTSRIVQLAAPAILLLALTGCGPGGGDGDAGVDAEGEGPTECMSGLWEADVENLGVQLGEYLESKGIDIVSASASGTQGLALDEQGYAGWSAESLQFVVVTSPTEGIVVTTTQTHNGTMRSDWGWDSDTVFRFVDIVDEGYNVETIADVNGTPTGESIDLPLGGMSDVPITAQCDGDKLVTQAEGSPFTTTWRRVGDAPPQEN
jgi:hypothetical protein